MGCATAGTLPWYINTIVENQENQQTDAAEQEETQKDPMSYCPLRPQFTHSRAHARMHVHRQLCARCRAMGVQAPVPIARGSARPAAADTGKTNSRG